MRRRPPRPYHRRWRSGNSESEVQSAPLATFCPDWTCGTRQRYDFGIDWPVGKRPVLDTYYCRQNDSRSGVAHVDAVGLALQLFF